MWDGITVFSILSGWRRSTDQKRGWIPDLKFWDVNLNLGSSDPTFEVPAAKPGPMPRIGLIPVFKEPNASSDWDLVLLFMCKAWRKQCFANFVKQNVTIKYVDINSLTRYLLWKY